jgi:hypothetical protein
LQDKEADYSKYLNVYVVSRYPKKFLDSAAENGIVFTQEPNKPWMLRAKVACQDVVIIICRELPLERRYYSWLLFAPSDSKRWESFIRRLQDESETELLTEAERLRPKEFYRIMQSTQELLRQEGVWTPEVQAYYDKQRQEIVEMILSDPNGQDPFGMSFFLKYMDDQQLDMVVNALNRVKFAALLNYLEPEQLERVRRVAKPDKQKFLQLLLDEQ